MFAAKMGYENLFVYLEGMPVWEEFDYPRIKGPEYEARVETVKMPIPDMAALIKSGAKDFVIVDVPNHEYQQNTFYFLIVFQKIDGHE